MNGHYVVDTSVLIQALIEDSASARVETLLNMLDDPTPVVLQVPEFSLVECGNVLWKRVRFHNTPVEEVKEALHNLITLPLTVYEASILLPRALEIALEHELAVYDCVTLVLAERLRCPLVTVDERQANVASKLGVTLKPITDFPEYTTSSNR